MYDPWRSTTSLRSLDTVSRSDDKPGVDQGASTPAQTFPLVAGTGAGVRGTVNIVPISGPYSDQPGVLSLLKILIIRTMLSWDTLYTLVHFTYLLYLQVIPQQFYYSVMLVPK